MPLETKYKKDSTLGDEVSVPEDEPRLDPEAIVASPDGSEQGTEGTSGDEASDDGAPAAAQLGATRYVMAGFFLTGIAGAYVIGRMLSGFWGRLAEAAWFQKSLAPLARVSEESRSEYSTMVGAVAAVVLAVYAYRRADVRQWTDEVASELSKVTWPDKAEVTNSTVIVIVTSAFATVYLALLDRFWGFVTNLVYGSS